ncbi:MAG: hypothetical protein WDN49_22575 [Acetobacteraceae bacterium]
MLAGLGLALTARRMQRRPTLTPLSDTERMRLAELTRR